MALQQTPLWTPPRDDLHRSQTAWTAPDRWHESFSDLGMHTITRRFAGSIAFYTALPAIGSIVAWLLGGMALLGWTLNVPALYTVIPGWGSMVPATATGLIISGSALWLLRSPNASPGVRWCGWFLATCAGVLGMLMLAEHIFPVNVGIDKLLFPAALTHAHAMGLTPGRLSANTSLNFVLIAAALLTADLPTWRNWHPDSIMATLCLLIALVGMIGTVYGAADMYRDRVIGYHTMSLPTATAFTMLGIGVLLARRDHGIPAILVSDGAGGVAARLLIPVAVLLPLAVGGVAIAGVQARLFSPPFGMSLALIVVTCALVAAVTWNAHQLHSMDVIRQRYADDLGLQIEESQALAEELEETNAFLREAGERADEARATAEQANRAKADFLAVMSHELRTPLNATIGYTELLEMGVYGTFSTEQHDVLMRISKSSRHLLGLINDILDFTKVEAGAITYRKDVVALDAAVYYVVGLIEPQARAKNVAIHVQPPVSHPGGVEAICDRDRVQQVLLNLLSNAIKFSDPGGRVTLQCERAGTAAFVRVIDTGRGIASDVLARVFEPFVQVDSRLTRTAEGTGLGLSVSRTLARGMDGDVTVESTPGAGSVFTVMLPTHKDTMISSTVTQ